MIDTEMYAAMRYYRNRKRPTVLKYNLTLEQARDFCEQSPTKRGGVGHFNSFVGFTKMANL